MISALSKPRYRVVRQRARLRTRSLPWTPPGRTIVFVAQADAKMDSEGRLLDEYVTVRVKGGDVETRPREEVTLMDISPARWFRFRPRLSPSWSTIDANRAPDGFEHAAPGRAAFAQRKAA